MKGKEWDVEIASDLPGAFERVEDLSVVVPAGGLGLGGWRGLLRILCSGKCEVFQLVLAHVGRDWVLCLEGKDAVLCFLGGQTVLGNVPDEGKNLIGLRLALGRRRGLLGQLGDEGEEG
jgi:hypothetical protein